MAQPLTRHMFRCSYFWKVVQVCSHFKNTINWFISEGILKGGYSGGILIAVNDIKWITQVSIDFYQYHTWHIHFILKITKCLICFFLQLVALKWIMLNISTALSEFSLHLFFWTVDICKKQTRQKTMARPFLSTTRMKIIVVVTKNTEVSVKRNMAFILEGEIRVIPLHKMAW